MRSRTHAEIWDEKGTRSWTDMRYGLINSPGLPSRVIAVKPMTVAEISLLMFGCGWTGFNSTAHRKALT